MLFTFPSRYCFTIGHLSCLALDHGRPEFNRNFTCSGLLRYFAQTDDTPSPTGLSPSTVGFPNTVQLAQRFVTVREFRNTPPQKPLTPACATLAGLHAPGLGSSPFAHHYLGNLVRFLLYPATEMFHFAGFAPAFIAGLRPAPERLPHSETFGSMAACPSPKLFAAYRVLHR